MPFTAIDTDGQWRPVVVQQEMAPGITCELIVSHQGAPDRLIVLSAPRTAHDEGVLSAFAHRIKDAFSAYRSTVQSEFETVRLDFSGVEMHFQLEGEANALDCELFVFADELAWWGVLYSRPRGSPSRATAAFNVLHRNAPVRADVVAMAPLRVRSNPVSNFPLSFEITRTESGERVASMVVTEVFGESRRMGIRVGDAILSVDGRRTDEFSAGVGKESELGRIFLNRRPGDEVVLEILRPGADKPRRVTLRAPARTAAPRR